MVGMSPLAFAVWGYVIGNMVPDNVVGAQVELNPVLMKGIFGGTTVEEIEEVINKFCGPDAKSRTKDEEGRKLVRLGQYDYRVVNGAKYRDIRKQENRRKQNREAQERFRDREKKKRAPKGTPMAGETAYCDSEKRKALSEEG